MTVLQCFYKTFSVAKKNKKQKRMEDGGALVFKCGFTACAHTLNELKRSVIKKYNIETIILEFR